MTAKPKVEPVTEVWTYLGVRFDEATGKLYHYYRDASGQTLGYGKNLATSRVGHRYSMAVIRDENGGASVLSTRSVWFGEPESRDEANECIALSAAERTRYDARKADKRSGAVNPLLSMTILELRVQMRKLPTPQRRALLANLLDLLNGGYTV